LFYLITSHCRQQAFKLLLSTLSHCCRPDLVDYRQARQRSARHNLDMAFNIFEREFGITRLLDPEGTVTVYDNLWLNETLCCLVVVTTTLAYDSEKNVKNVARCLSFVI